jgi:uroporphyrinogen-III synthase
LFDKTLLLARVDAPSAAYVARAQALGYQLWHRSLLDIIAREPTLWRSDLLAALQKQRTHLVFSSQQAVHIVRRYADAALESQSLFAVGPASAARLAPHPAEFPQHGEGARALFEHLLARFAGALSQHRFVLLQAPDAKPDLEHLLRSAGAVVLVIVVYERAPTVLTRQEQATLAACTLADMGSSAQLQVGITAGLGKKCQLLLPSQSAIAIAEAAGYTRCLLVPANELMRLRALA